MKKIILILIAVICYQITIAQTAIVMTSQTYGQPDDTVTSTVAKYMIGGAIATNKTVAVVLRGIEISGTTNGTATLEASLDAAIWYPYYGSHDSTFKFTLTDITTAQIYGWDIYDFSGKYLRVKVVGVGTTNFAISAKYMVK